jgi:uncharacterized protein YdaT
MNHKLKQVTVRASRASKSLFHGSSSSSSKQEAMLRCAHGEDEQCPIAFKRSNDGEEERRGEEVKNVGEGPNEEEEEAELEHVSKQSWRSHMVAPPIAPTWEEVWVLIKPLGDR